MLIKLAALAAFFVVVLSVWQFVKIIKDSQKAYLNLKTKNELLMSELVANETKLSELMEYET